MFFSAQFDTARLWPRANETAIEYWLSFSPAAPIFGVKWRFADFVYEPGEALLGTPKPAEKARRVPIKRSAEEAVVLEEVKPAPTANPAPRAADPVKTPAPAAKAAEPAPKPDDLTAIKGIGPKMAEKLNARGVTTYAQIAKWTKARVAKMDAELGGLPGAIERADWVGQAKARAG